jgi:hypothetical protein
MVVVGGGNMFLKYSKFLPDYMALHPIFHNHCHKNIVSHYYIIFVLTDSFWWAKVWHVLKYHYIKFWVDNCDKKFF